VTHPEPSGERAAKLVRSALSRAGLGPEDVDYVNAHGTGTVPNDRMEAKALSASLGDSASRVAVSSSKGQLGHTLGAAGALEAALTVIALRRGEVPPTAGLESPEEPLLRHVPQRGISLPLRAALSCSFGFGGTGAVLLFENAQAELRGRESPVTRVVVTGLAAIGARGVQSGDKLMAYVEPGIPAGPGPYAEDPVALLDPARSRRFDRTAAFATATVERAVRDARLDVASTGLVMGTAFGSVERSVRFVQKAVLGGPRLASPAEFPHLVVSAASGNASIYLGLTGPVFAASDRETSAESALAAAVALLGAGQAPAFVAGGVEAFDPLVEVIYPRLARGRVSSARGEGAAFLVVEDESFARSRGARVLARLEGPFAVAPSEIDAVVGPKAAPERSFVVTAALASEHEAALDRSSWGSCARRSVLAASGHHEAAGGFALSAAAALVGSGHADEVLAVGGRPAVLWISRFFRADEA
jgi:3-oxoacyl-[acyl-carrier-protein] synthase II